MDIDNFYKKKMNSVREFTFNIENAKFTVISDEGLEFLSEDIPEPEYERLHFHAYYELFYINEGQVVIIFENERRKFEKDDFIIVTPEVHHKTVAAEPGTSRYTINFIVEKNSVKSNFSLYDALKNILADEFLCIKDSSELRELIKKVVLDIIQGDEILLGLHFHELVIKLLEKQEYHQSGALANHTLSDSNMIRMYKLQQIIFTSYHQDLSLSEVAEKLFLSVRQVSRIIKQYYGCTYRELMAKTRMKMAAELLEKTNISVLDIAARIGYTSIKGFYTYFKKEFDCLPTEYRKRMKKHK